MHQSLEIDPIAVLDAESTVTARIVYVPGAAGECGFKLRTTPNVGIVDVGAALADGTVLAFASSHENSGSLQLSLGSLEVTVILTVQLRAIVPVQDGDGMLFVEVDGGEATSSAAIRLRGSAKFLAARSRLTLSDAVGQPGQRVTVSLGATNDGTAIGRDVRVRLAIPEGANFVEPEGATSWREVDSSGARSLVVALGDVRVGQRINQDVVIELAAASPDGREIEVVGSVEVGSLVFPLDAVRFMVRASSKAAAKIRVIDSGTYRFGDRVMAVVSVKALGTDVVRDVVVRVACDDIAWVGAGEDGVLEVPFGTLLPFAQEASMVEGLIAAAPSGAHKSKVVVKATGVGNVAAESAEISLTGASRIVGVVSVGESKDAAHVVGISLRNVGDGTAESIRVSAIAIDGVVSVVDSLKLRGASRYALDGTLAVETPGGFEVGPLGIAEECAIAWTVRSARAQRVTMAVAVVVDGVPTTFEAEADLVEGIRVESASTRADDAVRVPVQATFGAVAARVAPLREVAAEGTQGESTTSASEGDAGVEHTVAHDDAGAYAGNEDVVDADTESGAAPEAGPIVYGFLETAARARFRAWFGVGATEETPLGMHVLALREFLPIDAVDASAASSLATVRSESEEVVAGRLEAYKRFGTFGASGFDFGTPRLRAALASFVATIGDDRSVEGIALDRTLADYAKLRGVGADEVAAYAAAVAAALDEVTGAEDYGDAAPALCESANALCEVLFDKALVA